MGSQLGASPFQEATRTQQDIISSLFDLDDELFQQEIQNFENQLFYLDPTDPISSSLPLPEGSPFMLDLYNFNAEQAAGLQPNIQNHHQPILPVVEQYVEPDVRDTFLNDFEFGLISPTGLSSDIINNINEFGLISPTTDNGTEFTKNDDDEDSITDEDRLKQGILNSKNKLSERKRRNRLSKQLLSLRALVPNITKMDKRSVLVDALSYLRNIHEEIEMLQKEMIEPLTRRPKLTDDLRESSEDNASETLGIPCTTSTSASVAVTKSSKAQITEIDTEKIDEKRFIVKITCKGGVGVGSDVLQIFESLDFEITSAVLRQQRPQQVLVTICVRVRKQWKMTEQKLKHSIRIMAMRIGLSLLNPCLDEHICSAV